MTPRGSIKNFHFVESPSGLVHVAPFRTRTLCGIAIDVNWSDLGRYDASPFKHRLELPLCEKCQKQEW